MTIEYKFEMRLSNETIAAVLSLFIKEGIKCYDPVEDDNLIKPLKRVDQQLNNLPKNGIIEMDFYSATAINVILGSFLDHCEKDKPDYGNLQQIFAKLKRNLVLALDESNKFIEKSTPIASTDPDNKSIKKTVTISSINPSRN